MRLAIILAREAGADVFAVISGPEKPYPEQVDRWKGLIATAATHTYAEIQLWTSDEGVVRRKKFRRDVPPRDGGRVDLAQELNGLTEDKLRELAGNHRIDLAGLTAKEDLVTAIVIAVRLEHLSLDRSVTSRAEGEPPVQQAAGDDPGVFGGPSVPRLLLPASTSG